jgi:hypothetical protein
MPKYLVTIVATVIKQYEVEAEDRDSAAEEAHERFNPNKDGTPETYEQNTYDVTEID